MSYDTYTPNQAVCDKAASIWRKRIQGAEFDQLGDSRGKSSPNEVMNEGFAQTMVSQIAENTTLEMLDTFEKKFSELLTITHVSHWEKDSPDAVGRFERMIDVDYHANGILKEALDFAGIPAMQAPIKSNMWLDEDGLNYSFGYRAKPIHAYLADGGQFVVTELSGNRGLILELAERCPDRFGWE